MTRRLGARAVAVAVATFLWLAIPGTFAAGAAHPDRALYLEAQAALATLRQSPARLARRADWEQVVAKYRRVVGRYPQSAYCDDTLLAIGDLYRKMALRFKLARYNEEAVGAYRSLVSEYPSSGKGEQALFSVLEIARATGERKEVAEAARAYLAAFPESRRSAAVRAEIKQSERSSQPSALPSPPPPGLARVFNLRSWSGESSTRIVIDVERKVAFHAERIQDPDRLFVDLEGTRLHPNLDGRSFPVGDGLLEKVRLAQNKDNVVRVVLDFKDVKDQSVFYLENPIRLVVDVRGNVPPPPVTEVREAVVVPAPEPTPAPLQSPTPMASAEPLMASTAPQVASIARFPPASKPSTPAPPAGKPRTTRTPAVVATWPSGEPPRGSASPPPLRPVVPGGWTRLAPAPTPAPVPTPPLWVPEPPDFEPAPAQAQAQAEPAVRLPAPRVATLLVPSATPEPVRRPRPALSPIEGTGPAPHPAATEPTPAPKPALAAPAASMPQVPALKTAGYNPAPQPPQANRAGSYSLARQLGLGARRIVIDAGHGGHDPGCIGAGGLQEKDLVLDVSQRLERMVREELGAEVLMTRGSDVFVPLEERTAIANSKNADLFLSVHANSSPSPSARGVETYFLNFTADRHAEAVAARENAISAATLKDLQSLVKAITLNSKIDESRDFAQSVQESMVARLRPKHPEILDRGVRTAPFYVLIGANMPSILAEISFVTSPADERLLRTPEHREQIAASLFDGVKSYLAGLDRSGTRPAPDPTRRSVVAAKRRR